jgi:hypothetical protein
LTINEHLGAISFHIEVPGEFGPTGECNFTVFTDQEATDEEVWDIANRLMASDYCLSRMTGTPVLSMPAVIRRVHPEEPA